MKLQAFSPTPASAKPMVARLWVATWCVVVLVCLGVNAEQPRHFDRNAFATQTHAAFSKADRDGDRLLTLDEFLATYRDADGRRKFLLFDFDASGKLDGEEYRTLSAPVDERGDVPDPIVDIETAALARWEAIFAAADQNHNGSLSRDEWPANRIAAELPVLAALTFAHWDRAGDGKVDRADWRWLLDVAYGLTQLDGRTLRTKTGKVFSWYYFRHLDADTDGFVSAFEFGMRHNQGQEKNAETFAELDADGDGRLTDRETWPLLLHDTIAQFFDYDRNQDGYLTADEMLTIGWGRSIARQCVPAFDNDRDGRLSFREFRQTTFANQTSAWPIRHDTDRDGRLSWKEFYTEQPPLLIGQYRFLFDRFDRNHDGFLSVLEFTIEGDANQSQMLTLLQPLERCLALELEFAKRVGKLTDEQSADLEQAAQNAQERLAEKAASGIRRIMPVTGTFLTGNPNRQGPEVPTASEMALIHSPHLVLRRELVEYLKSVSATPTASADTWKRLDRERLAAEQRRRQAAALARVAALDQVLLLSTKQRSELFDLLVEDAADAWWQPVKSTTSAIDWFYATAPNGGFVGIQSALFLPESELEARLTTTQRAVLQRLQEAYALDVIVAQRAAVPGALANRAGVAGGVKQAAAAPMARRVIRSGPSVEVLADRLTLYLEQRLDDISAACGLTRQQRDKLLVAAKLDLARWREQPASADDKLDDGEQIVVQKAQGRGVMGLPLTIFSDETSFFQKAIQSRLSDDEKQKLVESDRQRREFQHRALVAAVVAGYERAASLTSAQCDALAAAFDQSLDDSEFSGTVDIEAEFIHRIGQVPFDRLEPLFSDFQHAGAQQYNGDLTRFIQLFEELRGRQIFPAAAVARPRQISGRQ